MTRVQAAPAARILAVQTRVFIVLPFIILASMCSAQEPNAEEKPQVKVNVLNVCSPSQPEQQEISSALARIPKRPSFSPDFEIDRGRSVLDPNANPLAGTGLSPMAKAAPEQPSSQAVSAHFVRIRHDFTAGAAFSTVQYSFSRDSEEMVETIVFRVRDPKDLLEISIESRASSVTTPSAMLTAGSPAGRIKLERFGKSSVVLARCSARSGGAAIDQSAYEPLFSAASGILTDYRDLLGTRKLVPEELARMNNTGMNNNGALPRKKTGVRRP